jgi:YjbR
MGEPIDVAPATLDRLRARCLELPEAYEELAWVGTRWRVRGRTFAHVLTIANGWPPAYARAAATDGPATLLTFRSAGPELAVLDAAGPPFFRPPWRADEVGLLLTPATDWGEVVELLTESYCVQAPRRLVELVDRPS